MSVSLYRKYRPQNFSAVSGQKTAIDVLTNSITKSRTGHAYLFSGSRGCGKTSVARIFAKALNCLDRQGCEPCGKCRNCQAITAGESLDVIEIDGASNNSVEEVRELKANVALAPFSSKYKIYIIDEVHMLSTAAFNALLKTLEEPPDYVVFIMATTEPQKVPVTIRSRCQHIPFHTISPEDIYARLNEVCRLEGVNAESEALWEIARQADGALRDALSLLEQVTASGEVTLPNVEAVFGAGSRPAFERWAVSLRKNPEEAYNTLSAMFRAGASGVRVFEEMFSLVRNMWLVSKWKGIADDMGLSSQEKDFLNSEVPNWKTDTLHVLLADILEVLTHARAGIRPEILLGMFMLGLEPAPVIERKVITQPVIQPQTQPKITPKPQPELQPDSELKAKILEKAHDNDLVIWCALFDSLASGNDGVLNIELGHRYCYEILRQDRRSVMISRMFPEYSDVILRHGELSAVCAKSAAVIEQVRDTPHDAQHAPSSDVPASNSQGAQPAPSYPSRRETLPDEPEVTVRTNQPSLIETFRAELARMGAKPEILIIRQNEAQDEDITDIEPESDNDE